MAQTVNIPFFQMRGVNVPLIEGTFRNKDGKMTPCYFQIDTGSVFNILNPAIMDWIDKRCITTETRHVYAMDEESQDLPLAFLKIGVGEECSTEHFCVSDTTIFTEYFGDLRIVGILGSNYLLTHELVVDFEQQRLRSFSTQDTTDFNEMAYVFPMEIGLKYYGVPMVGIVKEDNVLMFVADSGCDFCTITKYTLDNGAIQYEILPEERERSFIDGKTNTTFSKMKFNLMEYDVSNGDFITTEKEDAFEVITDMDFIGSVDNESAPPISGLFSTGYMLKHKWILDYKRQIIYAKAA